MCRGELTACGEGRDRGPSFEEDVVARLLSVLGQVVARLGGRARAAAEVLRDVDDREGAADGEPPRRREGRRDGPVSAAVLRIAEPGDAVFRHGRASDF
jgi:hypothetical protein